jgi:glucose/arabinose dehydrogenase
MYPSNTSCNSLLRVSLAIGLLASACRSKGPGTTARPATDARTCASAGAGITVRDGFCATIFADGIGHARHLAVAANGTVYMNTWSGRYYGNDRPHPGGFLVALRDTTGDGRADVVSRFGDSAQSGGAGGTGIALYQGALYAEANDKVLRYSLGSADLAPTGAPEVVIDGLPLTGDHPMHPFAIDSSGGLFLSSGSASNSCQVKSRATESPGRRPCTELATRAGVWRYMAAGKGQHFSGVQRFATGIRNIGGITIDPTGSVVYATQHGRDQLAENWPQLYTPQQGANFPSEELLRVEHGADYGWPECYFDSTRARLVLAPEYGGDGGKAIGPCRGKRAPVAYFPAHWAPNDLVFYTGTGFPARYRGGVFIAFHGSWNRAPAPQGGYNLVFVPFENGNPSGPYEIFADGFAGATKDPGGAAHRPSGLAVGPDGALYVADDAGGRVWRIAYTGETTAQSPAASVTATGQTRVSVAPRDPATLPTGVTSSMVALGDSIYHGEVGGAPCTGCHGINAKGTSLGPDLTDNQWLWSDGSYASIVNTIREGVPIPKQHTGVMPPMGGARLTTDQLGAVGAFVYAISHPSTP